MVDTACARSAPIKSSVQKVNLVASLIRRLAVAKAVLQLRFCKKKVSQDLLSVLNAAIANAENNCGMDIDNLVVSRILVNKAFCLKRMRPKSKGRAGKIRKPFTKVVIFVESVASAEKGQSN